LPEGFLVAIVGLEFQLYVGELSFIGDIDKPEAGIAFIDGH
jgi:hypothetical protein